MPEWTQDKPTEPGIYLRSNPPISAVVWQDVVQLDDKLMTVHGACDQSKLILVEHLPDRFWYYGPIPQPSWKQEAKP